MLYCNVEMAACFRLTEDLRLDKKDIAIHCLVGKPSTCVCSKLGQSTAITGPCARCRFQKSRHHIRIFVSISPRKHAFALRIMKKHVKLAQRCLKHILGCKLPLFASDGNKKVPMTRADRVKEVYPSLTCYFPSLQALYSAVSECPAPVPHRAP